MASDRTLVPTDPDGRHVAEDLRRARVLQELERQGYVIEPPSAPPSRDAICRHPVAPSLLVKEDGQLELLNVQPHPQSFHSASPPLKRIHWPRGLLFLAVLGVVTFLGLLVVAMIVG